MDYDADDTIITGYIYKVNTPEINKVNRSEYGKGTAFKQYIAEVIGNNCYIPTRGHCSIKCINYLKGEDFNKYS